MDTTFEHADAPGERERGHGARLLRKEDRAQKRKERTARRQQRADRDARKQERDQIREERVERKRAVTLLTE